MDEGEGQNSSRQYRDDAAIVVTGSHIVRATLTEMLEEQGIRAVATSSFAPIKTWSRGGQGVCLIDIDSFGGATLCIDRLLELRRALESTPVILMSCEFATDDFDADRAAVADVSLRLPVTRARLRDALWHARVNRRLSMARCAL